jgi:hypothetical protein
MLYRAARDRKAAEYFSCEADARSAVGHWLAQRTRRRSFGLYEFYTKQNFLSS